MKPIYYKFEVETPFCGTNETIYWKFDVAPPTEDFLNALLKDFIQDNAESYLYLLGGYGMDHEDYLEEEEEYLEGCSGYYEEITEEEYKKGTM